MRATPVVRPAGRETLVSCLSNDFLHLVLLPTESCNFRCTYCYESFRYGRMEPRVVDGIKALLTRRVPSLKALHVSWFGGEPLLARDLIEEIMTAVQHLADASPGLRLSSDATTNGYLLTREAAEGLVARGVSRFQVSLDGPREWHDRRRGRPGGSGTFDRIWENLISLRESDRDFTITIRIHVDRENAGAIPRFLDQCADALGSDRRYEVFVRGLSRLGGAGDHGLHLFEPEEGEAVFESLRAYARDHGLRTLRLDPPGSPCYAARANSFVVRADGRLNKCTVSLEHANNQVGRIGEDGTIAADSERLGLWIRGLRSGLRAELECPMKGCADPPEWRDVSGPR